MSLQGGSGSDLSLPPATLGDLLRPERLRVLLGMARYEFYLSLRSTEFRVAMLLTLILVVVSVGGSGTSASLAGYRISRIASNLFGFLTIIWFSAAACRDIFTQTEVLVLSKPQASEPWVLARLLGNIALACVALAVLLIVGATAQVVGGHTPLILMAYLHAFRRSLVPLLCLGSLSYSMSLLFRTPVAGAVVGLYWISILLGRNFLSRVFNVSFSQNAIIYLPLALAVVLIAAALYRRDRRGHYPALKGIKTAIILLLALSGIAVWWVVAPSHDPPLRMNDFEIMMGGQRILEDTRVPGFWLEDQNGQIARLGAYPDHILVILLWSPEVPESVALLDTLARIYRDHGPKKVTPVAICIAEDYTIARDFAREQGYQFPVVIDKGSRFGEKFKTDAPLAEAYEAESLPKAIITDRRHFAKAILNESESMAQNMILQVRQRLKEEPD